MIVLFAIGYISYFYSKFLSNKIVGEIKEENTNNTILNQRISLKGRVKRNPNNINYNELFIEVPVGNDKDKSRKKKKGNNLIEKTVCLEENKVIGNLEDFFERVNEKNEFEKIFNNNNLLPSSVQNKSSVKEDNSVLGVSKQNNMDNNLIFFDQKENKFNNEIDRVNTNVLTPTKIEVKDAKKNTPQPKLSTIQNRVNKIISYSQIKEEDEEKIEKQNTNKIDENDEKEKESEHSRLETKMRNNSDIFYLTPLFKIRRNTEPKKI